MPVNQIKKLSLFLVLMLAAACNEGREKQKDNSGQVRTSKKIDYKQTSLKSLDLAPSLVADGTKVAFLSGRSGRLRAYLFAIGTAESADNPSVILGKDSDFGEESEVQISSAGTYAAIKSYKDSKTAIIAHFIAANTNVTVVDSADVKGNLALSYDEKLLAYTTSKASTRRDALFVSTVDAAAKTVSTPVKVEGVTAFAFGPIWLKNATSSIMLIGRYNQVSGAAEFQTLTFTTGSNLNPVIGTITTADAKGKGLRFDREAIIDSTADRFAFVEHLLPNKDDLVEHSGDKVEVSQKYGRDRRIDLVPSVGGTATIVNPSGYSLTSFATTASGLVATVVRQYISCLTAEKGFFAQGIQLLDTTVAEPKPDFVLPLYFPSLTENKWRVSDGMCKFKIEDSDPESYVDFYVHAVAINASATKQNYTMVYSSNFSADESGNLIDTDLYLVQFTTSGGTGSFTLKPLSENHKKDETVAEQPATE